MNKILESDYKCVIVKTHSKQGGGGNLLKELLTQDVVQFTNQDLSWEEAIQTAATPLLQRGSIENAYINAMIQNVKDLGPYILLMPGFAMPHARPENGVNQMGVSVLINEKEVEFDADKKATVFFVLAATDNSSHLGVLAELSTLLSDEEKFNQLANAKTYHDVVSLF